MDACKVIYKAVMAVSILTYRQSRCLSQERMAELLHISTRSYADLEHEKFCCSGMTLVMFLVQLSDDEITHLVNEFRKRYLEQDRIGVA